MAIEVFNRYEKKYIIDEDTFHKLTYQIADYMNPDAYNRRKGHALCFKSHGRN